MFEQMLERKMSAEGSAEKTSIDKLLGKEDVKELRNIIRKKEWSREDMLDVLNMISSSESKLYNLGEHDRYVMLKFFAWIREFVRFAELRYDYEDFLKKEIEAKRVHLSAKATLLMEKNKRLIEHDIKFLVDLYLNISRTSLSLGGMGFLEMLKSKFEITYPQGNSVQTPLAEMKK